MLPELLEKADELAANFGAIKVVAFFSKDKVVARLRDEVSVLSPKEIEEVLLYLAQALSKPDFKKFVEYLQIATGQK
jgi:predicted Zn-dependent peptidase